MLVPDAPWVKVTAAPPVPPKMNTFDWVLLLHNAVSASPTTMIEWMVPEGRAPVPEMLMVGWEFPRTETLALRETEPSKILPAGMVTRTPVVDRDAPTRSVEAGTAMAEVVTQGVVP